jgi:hypothetical protein
MAQMRRIFYCRINLAILLIGRQIATILPQAAHRRATLAARFGKQPLKGHQRRVRAASSSVVTSGSNRNCCVKPGDDG